MNRAVVGGHHPGLPVLVPVTFSTRQTYPVGDLSLSRKRVRAARAILQRGLPVSSVKV